MISKNLSNSTKKFYYKAITGFKILKQEDLDAIDKAIEYCKLNSVELDLITDIYLLWTLPIATKGGDRLLENRTQTLTSILQESSFNSLLEFPIGNLKTHGAAIDKYVLQAKELGLDSKQVAECIGAHHYILNSGEFSDEEITRIFQFRIDNSTNKWLRLSSMKLKQIPEGILNVKGVVKIDLSRNPISYIPQSFFNLTDLKELVLEKTKILDLPDEIERLKNLEYLNLNASKLKTVSPKIGQLTKLRDLRFVETSLRDLPDEISRLTNLEYLLITLTPLFKNQERKEELKKLGCPL